MTLILALLIIAFAAGFHVHWALGGQCGYVVSLPQRPDGMPVMAHRLSWWRPAAAGVALFLIVLAMLLLEQAGYHQWPLPAATVRWALRVAGAAFVARAVMPNPYVGFFKTGWARYDTRLYSPLFLLLGVLILCQAETPLSGGAVMVHSPAGTVRLSLLYPAREHRPLQPRYPAPRGLDPAPSSPRPSAG